MWLGHPNFRPFLATFWNDYQESGGSLSLLAKKLKALKLSLQSWNIETFKMLDYEIEEGLNLVKDLDSAEEAGMFSEQERLRRIDVKCRLDWLWKLKEISWKQKSRESWLRLGDKNSRYFHQIANYNRRRNYLDGLFVNEIQVSGQQRVVAAAVSFYKSLYRERQSSRPFASRTISKRVSLDRAEKLLDPVTPLEIWSTIKSCAGDKAPGPDGFSVAFFKSNWILIKEDFCNAVDDFFSNLSLPAGINSTFLVLIPKVDSVAGFKDLRPISLIGGIYKVISEILMGRMKPLLSEVISPQQCAFIKNRQILDAVLIANEAIDSRLRSRKPGLVLKLDIEKAFDHVNWSCLFKVLNIMGFGERWINQIKVCVTTASSVLVNGESPGYFRSSKGLRQGDSLSPFLFIVVMEVLSGILNILQEDGRINGFCLNEARGIGMVNHILYADDAIIFCEASGSQLRYVMAALICFAAISGLKVNLHKSSLFPVGLVPEADISLSSWDAGWISFLHPTLGSHWVQKPRQRSFGIRLSTLLRVESNRGRQNSCPLGAASPCLKACCQVCRSTSCLFSKPRWRS
ncbi:LINE-1 retrotransposable element ORF2 protein [Linum perenne]